MRDGKFVFITGADNYNPINEIYNIYLSGRIQLKVQRNNKIWGSWVVAALQKSDTKIFALRQASL